MAYKIFSTLDGPADIDNPTIGPPGEIVGTELFVPSIHNLGLVCADCFLRFPTLVDGEELVSNAAAAISLWVVPTVDGGSLGTRQVILSLYNDSGSAIILFYDDALRRFGFYEAGVGEALEENERTMLSGMPLPILFQWNGTVRRLYIDANPVAQAPQGAEFMPDYLVIGGVVVGGERVAEWPPFEGVFDNLKVEDYWRDDPASCMSLGITGSDSRASFTRTMYESACMARLSANIDNQRNCYAVCSGASSARDCRMATGGISTSDAFLPVLSGSWSNCYISAPAISERSARLPGAIEISSERDSHNTAHGAATSVTYAQTICKSSATGMQYGSLTCNSNADAAVDAYSPVDGAAFSMRVSCARASADAQSLRQAASFSADGTEDSAWAALTGAEGIVPVRLSSGKFSYCGASVNAHSERQCTSVANDSGSEWRDSVLCASLPATRAASSWLTSHDDTSSDRGASCPCDIPVSRVFASVVCAERDATGVLELVTGWVETALLRDDYLAPMLWGGIRPLGWAALRVPRIALASQSLERPDDNADIGLVGVVIVLDIVVPQSLGGAQRACSRAIRAIKSAIGNGGIVSLAGAIGAKFTITSISTTTACLRVELTVAATPAASAF